MRSLLVSLIAVVSAGCTSTPIKVPEKVMVPVPVRCIDKLPEAPAVVPDAVLKDLDDYRLVLTIARDKKILEASYGELRAVAQACVK